MVLWKVVAINILECAIRMVRRLANPLVLLFQRTYYLAGLRMHVRNPVPASTQFDGPVRTSASSNLKLGRFCRFGNEVQFSTSGSGEIIIGDRVRINMGCLLVANCAIHIGDDTLIGEYVSIRDSNHGTATGETMRTQVQVGAPIHIGRDVWIGRGSCILKGVSIGDGAVIGANSVVTRDIPGATIYAGSPARLIRKRN